MSPIHSDFICEGVWLSDEEADLLNGDGDATLFLLTLRRRYIELDEPFPPVTRPAPQDRLHPHLGAPPIRQFNRRAEQGGTHLLRKARWPWARKYALL